jgi:hypothetical protein
VLVQKSAKLLVRNRQTFFTQAVTASSELATTGCFVSPSSSSAADESWVPGLLDKKRGEEDAILFLTTVWKYILYTGISMVHVAAPAQLFVTTNEKQT